MTRLILAAVIGLTTALPAAAQFKNAEAAIKYRQSVMQVQNHHLGRIFEFGTVTGRARRCGWFDAAALKMQEDVAKLNAAAKTGSLDAIKAAAGAVGQSCKACHDDYQAK